LEKVFTPQFISIGLVLVTLTLCVACDHQEENLTHADDYSQWRSYLGGPDRNHYTTLDQIDPANVDQLEVLWTYETPDAGQMQMNPVMIDGILYGITANMRVIALHAGSGKELWNFQDSISATHSANRGVSYWNKGDDKRLFFVSGPYLMALDALSGKPVLSFGNQGKVDLHTSLPDIARNKFITSTTPGTIYKDLIILPTRVAEDESAAPGDIVAYNIITGEVEWAFHTIPYPGEYGYETWADKETYKNYRIGGANNWAGAALDAESGILFVPTGSAAPDFYGAERLGENLFSNCLLAIDALSGKLKWHFQFVHHDLWDRDPPAPPNLITVNRDGQKIDAVAQITKQGFVFLFNRNTGEPLFDIEEVPVPASGLDGEQAWPTQPVPVKPKPFARQAMDLTEKDISPYAENKEDVLQRFLQTDHRFFAPPSEKPALLLPGYDGGAEWGGAAADPDEGILYVNSNEMAWILQMKENRATDEEFSTAGARVYQRYCIVCHQPDRQGLPVSGIPSLVDVKLRKDRKEILGILTKGQGMMPAFPQVSLDEKSAVLDYLLTSEDKSEITKNKYKDSTEGYRPKYRHMGYFKFLDSKGLPGISPPWGTLHAIDMNTGDYLWSVPLGETESLKEKGYPTTGTENYGGPLVSQNGLLFIAATKDGYFRAFDKHSGKILWEFKLPAPAFATPSTYRINNKQYLVIACGGEKLGTEKGNKIVAFGLGDH
jgi:quinoprotein glucose dehydrogenase